MKFVQVVGHRGVPSLFPENTLDSFRRALELGVDAIELDVRLTRDRRLVIVHDETVDRCSNGSGPVREFTFDEIRALDFGAWKGERFAGTRIPTFEEALDTIFAAAPSAFDLLIELKEDDDECTAAICRELEKRNLVERCVLLSFYASQLVAANRLLPDIRLQGFRMEDLKTSVPDAYRLFMRLCIWRNALSKEAIDRFHTMGIEVDTVPVDNAAQLDEILPYDLDSITTNAADVVIPLLRERGLRLPETAPAWRVHGAGLDNLLLEQLAVAPCGKEELLVRIDAIGLCFSDVKLIRAGESHPKIRHGLAERPLIPGHEAVMTVIRRGRDVPAQFAIGSRWVIQCDIFIGGESCAFGYGMDGGFTRFSRLDRRVWEGETRSWLLPCPAGLTDAAAALIEPWTCVNAAYRITRRTVPRQGGRVLLAAEPGNSTLWRAGELLRRAEPETVVALNLSPEAAAALHLELNRPVQSADSLPEGVEFDDIFCCGIGDRALGEAVLSRSARSAVVNFIGAMPGEPWKLDVGALHYRNLYYQADSGNDLSASYCKARRSALASGGTAWFAGGAGAMGQMHVQLALESAAGPSRILVTDLDPVRIGHVTDRLAPLAAKRGVELRFLNPSALDAEAFEQELKTFAPKGFDDVVILVPSAAVVQQAAGHLAAGALLNVFAGIPAGEGAELSIRDTVGRGCRFTGSSGSSLADMVDTLDRAASGNLRPERALAAVAGMNAVKMGLEAVAAGRFPGKTVIYPDCPDLPLTPLDGLAGTDPEAAAALDAEACWTSESEHILRKNWSKA